MAVIEGMPCTVPNRTDEVDTGNKHWYISYNSHDTYIYGDVTTALVLGQMEYFLILSGDHREGFAEAIAAGYDRGVSRLNRCLTYVREHKDQLNKFSDPII